MISWPQIFRMPRRSEILHIDTVDFPIPDSRHRRRRLIAPELCPITRGVRSISGRNLYGPALAFSPRSEPFPAAGHMSVRRGSENTYVFVRGLRTTEHASTGMRPQRLVDNVARCCASMRRGLPIRAGPVGCSTQPCPEGGRIATTDWRVVLSIGRQGGRGLKTHIMWEAVLATALQTPRHLPHDGQREQHSYSAWNP